jgi:large subunit ribosomal protein L34
MFRMINMAITKKPKKRKRKRKHGFLKRKETAAGRNVIKRRKKKGRKRLTA